MNPLTNRWIAFALICIVSLIVRVSLLAADNFKIMTGDAREYIAAAENLRDHGVFDTHSTPTPAPSMEREPGYSVFLLFTSVFWNKSLLFTIAAQIVLDFACIYLIGQMALLLWGSQMAAGAAMLLYAGSVQMASCSTMLVTENPSIFLTLATVFLLLVSTHQTEKRRYLISAAVLFGLNILTRPHYGLLLTVFVPALLMSSTTWREGLKRAFVFSATVFLVLSPWLVRNYALTGQIIFRSAGMQNNYRNYYEWVSTWLYHPRHHLVNWSPKFSDRIPEYAYGSAAEQAEVNSNFQYFKETGRFSQEQLDSFGRLYQLHRQSEPVRYNVLNPLKRMVFMWWNGRLEFVSLAAIGSAPLRAVMMAGLYAYNIAVYLLALVGFVWFWRRFHFKMLLFGPVVLMTVFLGYYKGNGLLYIEPRYLIQLYPLLFLPAGEVIHQLWLRLRRRDEFT